MALYQVDWVFKYLPVVLTVFTKVNHSHKVQKYVIIPSGVGIIYLPVVLTIFTKVYHSHKVQSMSLYHLEWVFRYLPVVLIVFTKVNHSHKVQKVCHYTKWSWYLEIYLWSLQFYKGKSQS